MGANTDTYTDGFTNALADTPTSYPDTNTYAYAYAHTYAYAYAITNTNPDRRERTGVYHR